MTPDLTMRRIGPPPPDGSTLTATLQRIEGLDAKPLDYGYGPCVKFVFEAVDDEWKGRPITRLASAVVHEYSQLVRFSTRLLDREIEEGEDLATALKALVGREFSVMIEHREANDVIHLHAVEATPASD